jgi:hypothetical protein
VECDIFINSERLLMTDFINLKIKLVQSFRDNHKDVMRVYIFIGVSAHIYINIYICTVFLKKRIGLIP